MSRLIAALFRPVDIAWLVYFRLGAGFLLALEHGGAILLGRVRNYTEPQFHFRYLGWEWLPHPPPAGIYALYGLVVAAGLAVAAGWHYRLAATLLSLGYGALLLLEETEYINHFYLYALVAAVLAVLPAHRAASADVRAGRVAPATTTPAWTRLVLLFQMGLVYALAALAKLNPDWLAARPLTVWLAAKANYPLIGPLLSQPAAAWALSYGGIVFDALVVPLLLWRRSRPWTFGVAVLFHLTNVVVFGLGTFPWFSILLTSLFFAPDFPRRLPGFVGRWFRARVPLPNGAPPETLVVAPRRARWVLAGLGLFGLVQLLLPLRHFLYPADVHWTEEGHRFSWHLMLRSKTGTAMFQVVLPGGREEWVHPQNYLTSNQAHKLRANPDLLLQFAQLLGQDFRRRGQPPVAIYCHSSVSLNGHPPRPLVNPTLNLLRVRRTLAPASWVLPGPVTDAH
ncbi:HTTM domain-containing protein [Hymenobacter sp. ISL-91]|uniref:HTTM domain-containing protein n=1 Tax=Hymenobacter sp. ISL-91 TaxID=2819151 RepID=UPI001BE850F4|nr:HTTM domain-containing protein [Hymenobacter sp. ISL-91]MBT2557404.1 HTTM domain-containing protein [Hymenobacter sp. ISL-91]